MNSPTKRLLKTGSMAERLSLTPYTVRRMLAAGTIPGAIKIGLRRWMIEESVFESWLLSLRVSHAGEKCP